MKCPKCYNEIPNDSKTCPICQTIFATYFEEIKLTTKQKIKLFLHKSIFPIIASLIIIVIISIKITTYKIKMSRIKDVNEIINEQSEKTYINDLYISDERHYKYLLNSKEKKLYNKIITAINNNESEIEIDIKEYSRTKQQFNTETIKHVKQVISMDHPELINLATIKTIENLDSFKIHITYAIKKEEYKNIEELIKQEIEKIKEQTNNKTEYEKIKTVKTILNEETKTTTSKDSKYNSAACLKEKECTSEGYAKLVQIILQNIRITSLLATGNINTKYHEWNIVKIENKYYYYDQTSNKLLFKNDNYELYNKKLMPTINGKKYITK